jgi:TetR/AcrR family transcriptional repressor of nem operon
MTKQATASPTAKPGRPAAFVRENAVEAAMNLFWKKGFLAVTARDLADAMAIQRSSFYNTFGNREKVFREALSRYGAQSPDAPLDSVKPGQPVVPVLVSFLRNVCHARAADAEARGCMVCNGIAELVGVEDTIGPLLEGAIRTRTAVIERLLRQAARQGEIALSSNAGIAAEVFIAFLVGLNTVSKIVRDEKQLWAMCRQFLLGLGIPKEAMTDGSKSGK